MGNSGQWVIPDRILYIKSITFGLPQDSYIPWSHQKKK